MAVKSKVAKVKVEVKKTTQPKVEKSLTSSNRIFITNDNYDKLIIINKNRPINPIQVQKLKASVLRNGVLRMVIVVFDKTTGNYVVVDGQHLTKVLQSMNYTIECQVVECFDENHLTQLMIDLNNVSKSWRVTDYAHAWAESGLTDYKILRKELAETTLQMSVLIMAYSKKSRGKGVEMMKQGRFEIVDKKAGDTYLKNVLECNKIVESCRPINEALVRVMLENENYNQKQMLSNLKLAKKMSFIFSKSEGKLLKQVRNIYEGNFK
jgi:hypothetical protein